MQRGLLAIALVATLLGGCPALAPGDDVNEAGLHLRADGAVVADAASELDATARDLGPTDPDATPSLDAEPTDAEPGDVAFADAEPRDAVPGEDVPTTLTDGGALDALPADRDATPGNLDATPAPDATPVCSPMAGQPCSRPGLCGATYDCDGACVGGTTAPTCPCGPAMCSGNTWVCTGMCCDSRAGMPCDRAGYCGAVYDCNGACTGGSLPPSCACNTPTCTSMGTWTACSDPPSYGSSCSTDVICGGTIDCRGQCSGGSLRPPCTCASLSCQGNGTWSACPDPGNLGQLCDTASSCGGHVQCDGSCGGGSPLPTCQCGSPTCSGCIGGFCGGNATCVNGSCQCAVNDCSCGVPSSVCTTCANGNVVICNEDVYGCGAATNQTTCNFGCDPATATCLCSPDTGSYCSPNMCFCSCGDFERPGQVQCDGTCRATATCTITCRTECGPL